jgi:hypothetical protein
VCTRGSNRAAPRGPSTSPLGVVLKRVVAASLLAPLVGALLYSSAELVTSSYPGGLPEFFATILVAYIFAASATLSLRYPPIFFSVGLSSSAGGLLWPPALS